MNKPASKTVKKFIDAIKSTKRKYLNSEDLSQIIGIYPDIINESLSYFDPMVKMDLEYNLVDLLPEMERSLAKKPTKKKTTPKHKKENKLVKLPYKSINEFVYNKMSFGGMVNRDAKLSDEDLDILKALVIKEQKSRK